MNDYRLFVLKERIIKNKRRASSKWVSVLGRISKRKHIDYLYANHPFCRELAITALSIIFSDINFIVSEKDVDFACDVDYLGFVGGCAFGVQIKPVTAKANFGNYSISERMKNNFSDFEKKYKGKVFIIFSLDGEIANKEIIKEIKAEIERLKKL